MTAAGFTRNGLSIDRRGPATTTHVPKHPDRAGAQASAGRTVRQDPAPSLPGDRDACRPSPHGGGSAQARSKGANVSLTCTDAGGLGNTTGQGSAAPRFSPGRSTDSHQSGAVKTYGYLAAYLSDTSEGRLAASTDRVRLR